MDTKNARTVKMRTTKEPGDGQTSPDKGVERYRALRCAGLARIFVTKSILQATRSAPRTLNTGTPATEVFRCLFGCSGPVAGENLPWLAEP